jgi:plasmid stabilization system protein ParE
MAKRKIIWSARARNDLFVILEFYHLRNGNKNYSRKLLSSFTKTISLIALHPEIGLKSDFQNIRNFILGDFCLFYRIELNQIEILTIWDSRQDPEKFKL